MNAPQLATRHPQSLRISPHLILVVLFCAIAAAPLLKPGYFWSAHDARHDVYFIFEYNRAIDSGDWLARWSPDYSWGYGYPMFLIYGPLSTFLGTMLYRFVGLGFTQSAEAVYALATLLAGLGMYGYVRSWMGRNAGLVAAVAYAFIPYRLVEVYVRASMAEYMALAWIPFILWGVRAGFEATRVKPGRERVGTDGNSSELIGTEEEPGRHSLLWPLLGTALAYGAIMVTSNLVALIFTPLLALYMLLLLLNRLDAEQPLRQLSKESLLPLLANAIRIACVPALGLLLGLLISAFFWMPAMAESKFVNNEQWYGGYFNPEQHFVYPFQLFQPGWGFGISQPGPDDAAQGGLSFQLGAVPLVLAILALIGLARLRPAWRRELGFYWLWLLLAIFLMLPISVWAWRHLGFVSFAQFPWRWLMLAVPPLAILASSVVGSPAAGPPESVDESWDRTRSWLGGLDLATLALAVLLVLGSYPYLQVQTPQPTPQQGPVSYAALMRFQQSSDRMTGAPKWVDLKQRPMWSDMAELYVQADNPPLGPDATRAEHEAAIARQAQAVTSKVDYRLMPQNETLAVMSLALGSDYEKLWVVVGQPNQRIVFNIAWFPGWRAYELSGENGEIIGELPVEREDGPLARIVVPVPQRTFYMLLRFEDTPVRTLGKLVSLVGWALLIAVVAVAGVFRIRRRRRSLAKSSS